MKEQLEKLLLAHELAQIQANVLTNLLGCIKRLEFNEPSFIIFRPELKQHIVAWVAEIGLTFEDGADATCGYVGFK